MMDVKRHPIPAAFMGDIRAFLDAGHSGRITLHVQRGSIREATIEQRLSLTSGRESGTETSSEQKA